MSQGLSFIRSLLDNPAKLPVFRKAKREYFTENEHAAYDFTTDYLANYNEVPTIEAFTSEEISLPRLRGNSQPEFYLDSIKKRYSYTELNERFPQLVETMRNRNVEETVDILKEMIASAGQATRGESYVTLRDKAAEVISDYDFAKRHVGLRGVTFGWDTADQATNGMMGGDLIVVAGRPSMGKSWILIYMAVQAWLSGKSIAFTSMEMSLMQIARRWIGLITGINPNFIRSGELGSYAEDRLRMTLPTIEDHAAVHLLAGDMSKDVEGIEAMIEEFDPDVVYVDAAYLLSPAGKKNGYITKWESISKVITQLKQIAVKHDKPMVVSVQFNRNVRKASKAGEVDLGDIGGSDSIPQDASIVLATLAGVSPFQNVQRVIDMLKNREGETVRWATRFGFTPVSMNEIPLIEEEDDEEDEEGYDSSWM